MKESSKKPTKLIIFGASAGGVMAMKSILPKLAKNIKAAIVLVIHRPKNVESHLLYLFQEYSSLEVIEANDKMILEDSKVYIAPANYHLLIESDGSISLSVDEPISFSKPSIDVAFVSALQCFQKNLVCVLLSGANEDGSVGLGMAKEEGAITIVQDPAEAKFPTMPSSALKKNQDSLILKLNEMAPFLNNLP